MKKLQAGFWALVAFAFGVLAAMIYDRYGGSPQPIAPETRHVHQVSEAHTDPQKRTFTLGKKFNDRVSACFTQEAAEQVVRALAQRDDAAWLVFQARGCFTQPVHIMYTKRVLQMRVEGSGFVNIYSGQVGSLTIFVITDWTALGTPL